MRAFLKKNARLFSSAFVARGVNSPRQLLPRPEVGFGELAYRVGSLTDTPAFKELSDDRLSELMSLTHRSLTRLMRIRRVGVFATEQSLMQGHLFGGKF